jgi:lipopolysaccharide transport system ATP-binding protein
MFPRLGRLLLQSPRVEFAGLGSGRGDYSLQVQHLSKCYRIGYRGASFLPIARLIKLLHSCRLVSRTPPETKEVWALRNVSFTVRPGTILGIIGPAGAGKTTLLRILARITLPTEGRVLGRGQVTRLLGVENGFNGERSGRENILICAALSGIQRGDILCRMQDIIEFTGLGELIDMPLKHYSGAMRLRLALSVVMSVKPDILLADEVLAVLDDVFRERFLEHLLEAAKAGMTTLIVSKDMSTLARLCDEVLWLEAGQIVKYGESTSVVREYQSWRPTVAGNRIGELERNLLR